MNINDKRSVFKIWVLLLSLSNILSSCVIYNQWHSSEGYLFDVMDNDYIFDLEKRDSVKALEMYFGLSNCSHDIRSKKKKKSDMKLFYSFHISSAYRVSCPKMPKFKMNSFSFTDKKGHKISSILYVELLENGKSKIKVLLDSLTDKQINETKYNCVSILAQGDKSCYNTKLFYINYDLEVGKKRYVKKIKYKRKWFFDINLH